jgi:hypothetical protein
MLISPVNATMWSSAMLSTTEMSPRFGSTTFRRNAEIANKIVVPIVDRSPTAHNGGRSCRIALMTGQLVPQATAIVARRTIASRRRKRSGCIRPGLNEELMAKHRYADVAIARQLKRNRSVRRAGQAR